MDAFEFLSTPSARRATSAACHRAAASHISIHALREEGDLLTRLPVLLRTISIHALREEGDNTAEVLRDEAKEFLSTPSARRATCGAVRGWLRATISIHALREEGDTDKIPDLRRFRISIHALREEGDAYNWAVGVSDYLFLSTPSARRATFQGWCYTELAYISIHALREEGD